MAIRRYFSLKRLVAGTAAVVSLLAALYLAGLLGAGDRSIPPAKLVPTPLLSGRDLEVGLRAGQLAPNFEISSPDGNRFMLSDLRGRPVLINFWARWCTSCLSEMPVIKDVQAARGGDNLTVLALNAGETLAEAVQFIDFLQAPFIYGLDPDLTVADAYGVYGLPMSVFLDSAGVVQAVYRGHADRARLETFVDAAVRAEPAADLAVVLRLVTTIPRSHVLKVKSGGEGRLIFVSKSLRCDATYCAQTSIDELRHRPGVNQVEGNRKGDEPTLSVRFDPKIVDAAQVIEALVMALEGNPDPMYSGPIEVQRVG